MFSFLFFFHIKSPQKGCKSPIKALRTPTKDADLSKMASPQRRILFEPKETTPSPIKSSPTKAYQKYMSLAESDGLALPYDYRFLAEVFRCVDTVISYKVFHTHRHTSCNIFILYFRSLYILCITICNMT